MFEKLSERLHIKQTILDKLEANNIKVQHKSLQLSALDLRVLEIVNKNRGSKKFCDQNGDNISSNCRICFSFTENMTHLFDENGEDLPLIDKLHLCACINAVS